MTIMNRQQQRVVLPRRGPDEFWSIIESHYAHQDSRCWKYLAILVLRESGWTEERIGAAFGHPRGHVARCLRIVKRRLRSQFTVPPGRDDEGFSDPDDSGMTD